MADSPVNLLTPKLPPVTTPPPRRPRRWKLWVLGFFLLIIAALIIGQSRGDGELLNTFTLTPRHGSFLYRVKNFFFQNDQIVEGQQEDRVNILLLGIGGPGHDGPFLSDTNIIASIKLSTKEIALIPVPRDLGVNVTGHGWRKINSANAFGEAQSPGSGGEFARQVFSSAFNLPIPYYIRVDFKAFEQIVDALGGITVNVPRAFTDTQFPDENYGFQTVQFGAGEQTMDGPTALRFTRSRHGNNGEGSDFARGRRQELALTAIKEKAFSAGTILNPVRIQQILSALNTHVTTNLSFDQMLYLATIARDLQLPAKTVVLDSSPTGLLVNTTGEDGAFILSPKSGNFDNIIWAVATVFEATSSLPNTPPQAVPNNIGVTLGNALKNTATGTKIEVQNGTWRAGLATRFGQKLTNEGFNVIRVGNSLVRPIDKTTIYILNQKVLSTTTEALSREFKAPAVTILPEWLSQGYDNPSSTESEQGMKYNTDADLLIILGTNTPE